MNGANGNGLGNDGFSLPSASAAMLGPPKSLMPNEQISAPKKGPKSMKKPSSAPKRFKSSFIFFSMAKHKEIKEQLAKDENATKTTNITKMVSDAWRNISPEERVKYDEMAKKDKARYEMEKASYTAPPGATKKRQRDPTAPRRPMSAFLAFANTRRAKVKAQRPDCTNGEISKILSVMWKEAAEDIKKQYREDEAALWAKYKVAMAEWRKKNEEKLKLAEKQKQDWEIEQPSMEAALIKSEEKGVTGIMPSGKQQNNLEEQGLPSIESLAASPNPNYEEIMAASALRGVRGVSSLLGGQNNQAQPGPGSVGYNDILRSGMSPFGSAGLGGLGGALGNSNNFAQDLNPNNRALLELGLPSYQQSLGFPFGNSQAMLMAQALQGAQGSFNNPLLGISDQQSQLLQLLAGGQTNTNGMSQPQSAGVLSGAGMNNFMAEDQQTKAPET